MKVVILAGGLGTRLAEETSVKPKPMVEIGAHPILWHIIKSYSTHGINDIVVCLGYRGFSIKEYFASYFLRTSNVTFNLASGEMVVHRQRTEPWRVTLVDTGEDTMTGGRLRRVREYLDPTETFCFTYGDGVSNVDISSLVAFHRQQGKLATLTAVQPPGRFGAISLKRGRRSSIIFARSLPATVRGSTVDFLYLNPGRSTTSQTTLRPGRPSRCRSWPPISSSQPIGTPDSGSRWTRCATRSFLRTCGRQEKRPGRHGPTSQMPQRR